MHRHQGLPAQYCLAVFFFLPALRPPRCVAPTLPMTPKNKVFLLRKLFHYLGNCSTPTRLRWGRALGWLAPRLLKSRRHIVRTNLALCFPELGEQAREALVQRHFHLLAQSVVDRGLCWFGTTERIRAQMELRGFEHMQRLMAAKQRILLLAPHFIGLDAAATRMTMDVPESATIYTRQSDEAVDDIVREGRARFNAVHLISRKEGVRGMIRHLRNGLPVYYLPDMDFGPKGAVFAPFFGVPAATLPTTAQIAQSYDATVLPVVSHLDLETGRYVIEVKPPLEDFPGEDTIEAATARVNRLIEDWVRADPAQYYWVHRRFKTRPEGAPGVY